MGVKGLIRLLVDQGCVTEATTATAPTALWRKVDSDEHDEYGDDNNARNYEGTDHERISNSIPLPKDATLHIDGNGLAFFLHSIAYARHVRAVVGSTKKKRNKPLTPTQQRILLPSFLPFTLVTGVVEEFRKQLPPSATILFYWDGSLRRSCKEDRSDKMEQEWENFHAYCTHGDFPDNRSAYETLFHSFPKSSLLLKGHIHYLFSNCCSNIQHITCEEEADPCMAARARGNAHQFVLGLDSDFILYHDINYIPLDRMTLIGNEDEECNDNEDPKQPLRVEVWKRNVLAERLGLQDASMLVELAILLGNDYISFPSTQLQSSIPTKRKEILYYLKNQGVGFRALGVTEDDEQRIQFVRSLYNYEDVNMFPLVERRRETANSSIRPQAPADLPVDELRLQPNDKSAKDAVLRVLRNYYSSKPKLDSAMVTSEHLDILKAMGNKKKCGASLNQGKWRPVFADVEAAVVISKAVWQCYSINAGSNKLKSLSPVQEFNEPVFHALLWQSRKQTGNQVDDTAAANSNPIVPVAKTFDSHPKEDEPANSKLPIDDHKDSILDNIQSNRITIIQGETGCGKSTRIPCMVLRASAPNPMVPHVRIFMSQPRRLAAKALVERIRKTEPDLKDKVALRMGHGVKEYESKSSAAFFTTTGYLVRYIAGNFAALDNVTHLIIDEVHERSVDTDILCLMCRRLLKYNPVIRLVLMSATLAADLYRDYFEVEAPPLKVGARRFPVEEVYLDDLSHTLAVSPADKRLVDKLTQDCDRLNAATTPNTFFMETMNKVVTKVTRLVAVPGRSILIFVPGMNDILALSESFDQMAEIPNVELNCYPIHSDVPFEDQMKIFDRLGPNEVRVFLATNSAESSITLPDVDNVICLGLCKQIVYNKASHRQMLLPTWISQASATQRSGRTGRVRPGTVYRMYTKKVYARFKPFEPGEMVRIPLDSVILMLKDNMIKDDPVTETLLECLEPPDVSTIERSFESLFKSSFITEATDMCQVTVLGKFVSSLGIDLALGAVLGLGIQFGVGAEAIQMVACLSFPQSPWKLPNAMMQETRPFNNLAVGSFTSKSQFDGSLFSDPFAMMNLVWEYEKSKNKPSWCTKLSIQEGRVRRLLLTCNNLHRRVAEHCGIRSEELQMSQPPCQMSRAKITILRIVQVWVFHETIIQCKRSNFVKGLTDQSFSVELGEGDRVTKNDLQQILSVERHTFHLHFYNEIFQKGSFTLLITGFNEFVGNFDRRLSSLFYSKAFDLAWVHVDSLLMILVRGNLLNNKDVFEDTAHKDIFNKFQNRVLLTMKPVSKKHGVGERPCGQYSYEKSDLTEHDSLKKHHVCLFYGSLAKGGSQGIVNKCKQLVRSSQQSMQGLGCILSEGKTNSQHRFNFLLCGDVQRLPQTDIQDLLSTPKVGKLSTGSKEGIQTILFPRVDDLQEASQKKTPTKKSVTMSASGPLFNCVPEGARLLAVVASSRRRDRCIRLLNKKDDRTAGKKEGQGNAESNDDLVITFNRRQFDLSRRWQRFNSDSSVYTPDTSVVASALPIEGPDLVYCCCANTLEVRGGGLRAEGLTLLPPGRLFLLLCRLSFGLVADNGDRQGLIESCLQWVTNSDLEDGTVRTAKETKRVLKDWTQRCNQALEFHGNCESMGESLRCHPEKIKELLGIFDGIGGIPLQAWDIAADATLIGRFKRK